MNTKINLVFSIILFSSFVYCKQYEILKLPTAYIFPKEEQNVNIIQNERSNRLWLVYSDRNDNYTFKKPDGGNIKKKCSIMQEFYVVEETPEWVHIVEDNPDYSSQTTKKMTDYG